MRGKPILALIFVAIMAIVLTIPLRGTSGERGERAELPESTPTPEEQETPTPEPTPTEEPTPTPEPTPTDTPEPPDEENPGRFQPTANYPDRCLTPAPEPPGDGLLAVARGDRIRISNLADNGSARVDGDVPFKWSPSGRYLMTGSGIVYNARGNEVASLFEGGTFSWSWSPVADCLVFASQEDDGVSLFVPESGTRKLGKGVLSRFSFSPDGRRLAYVEDADTPRLSLVRLTGGRLRTLGRPELSADEEIVLAGWTPGGTYVLFWQGNPDVLLESGRALSAVAASGGDVSRAGGRVLTHRDFLTSCGDDVYAIVGRGARTEPGDKRLARISVGGGVEYLTPETANDVSPTCSPQADLLAVARAGRANGRGARELTVIDTAGSVQFTPQQGGFDDAYPMWGRGDEGLLFIRRPTGGGDAQVWRVSESIPASATGVTVRVGRNPEAYRDSWGRLLDWSADEPSGVSVLSGSGS